MTEKKSFFFSKTLWGAVLGILGVLINQGILDFITNEELNQIAGLFSELVGFFIVIYGRVKATKKLK